MSAIEFLTFLTSSLVVDTAAIEIGEKEDELGALLSLRVNPSDMGSLIGRGGKTIDALRTVLRVYGAKSGKRINLRIIEELKGEIIIN